MTARAPSSETKGWQLSFALSGDEETARTAGATAYLAKPYSEKELDEARQGWLNAQMARFVQDERWLDLTLAALSMALAIASGVAQIAPRHRLGWPGRRDDRCRRGTRAVGRRV